MKRNIKAVLLIFLLASIIYSCNPIKTNYYFWTGLTIGKSRSTSIDSSFRYTVNEDEEVIRQNIVKKSRWIGFNPKMQVRGGLSYNKSNFIIKDSLGRIVLDSTRIYIFSGRPRRAPNITYFKRYDSTGRCIEKGRIRAKRNFFNSSIVTKSKNRRY